MDERGREEDHRFGRRVHDAKCGQRGHIRDRLSVADDPGRRSDDDEACAVRCAVCVGVVAGHGSWDGRAEHA